MSSRSRAYISPHPNSAAFDTRDDPVARIAAMRVGEGGDNGSDPAQQRIPAHATPEAAGADNGLGEEVLEAIKAKVAGKISPEGIAALMRILGEGDDVAEDEPPAFSGRPRPGGMHDATTAASRARSNTAMDAVSVYGLDRIGII
jgi:hypothetical protein